jgi:hypothetical protein
VLEKSPKLGQKWLRLAQPNGLFPITISNPQASHPIPLENVTNIINTASSLLQQTSTTTSADKENVPKAGNVGAKRGPNSLPRDPVTGLIIKPVDSDGNSIVRTRITKNNAQ